ncbi:MAG: cytochrome-c oxidase, cbb3-type subunit I [Myxococcales bacterium]|nr:cytochrome-c oxidase, cbb3-type subunit I [Myxococcales bacterium]
MSHEPENPSTAQASLIRITYNDKLTRQFVAASVVWGIVGMLVGFIAALQLAHHSANIAPYLTFGRLRPLHTNAVIFAFVGNMLFAGIYYSTQRLLKTRVASDLLGAVHFWGWQAIIVAAAITLPLGYTQGKEYAELEWPIDIAVTLIWVVFAINFFWTLAKRREKHLYVALWFYIATIVTVAMLYIVNNLAMPWSPLKSYSLFGGVQDALTQWWYGHNAVAFFLTTPVLGIMYYFLPKAAGRPVYSYRLSVIHFWALVFVYIWAGPHHLLYTALPEWAQTLGMVFSVMLWAPSWGGMLNGLLTLRGAWDKVRVDPVLKFFVAAVTFYGMATFEGPLLSIKSVNGLAHYTDWIVGHVHEGALGWNGFMAAGLFYWLVPRLYNTKLHSKAAADIHFWVGTVGILLYVISMWVGGITQGLMWRAVNDQGSLTYPNFVETLIAIRPMYWTRLVGGTMYLGGFCLMAWNLWRTARSGEATDGEAMVVDAVPAPDTVPWWRVAFGTPVVLTTIVVTIFMSIAVMSNVASMLFACIGLFVAVAGVIAVQLSSDDKGPSWHRLVEGRAVVFTVLTVLAVFVGGVAELIPSLVINREEARTVRTRPYTPLELEGRDIYIREGCYNCHSQMIRPMRAETMRYGEPSRLEESIFDHPFQWGSKRTGPDLAREGGRYPNLWHLRHLADPRSTSPGSNMPAYPHLATARVDLSATAGKLEAMRTVGVPYPAAQIGAASQIATAEANVIAEDLRANGARVAADSEAVALIAYLQRLGRMQGNPDTAAAVQAATPAH